MTNYLWDVSHCEFSDMICTVLILSVRLTFVVTSFVMRSKVAAADNQEDIKAQSTGMMNRTSHM